MICVIRMNPACVLVWPKFALFTLFAPCSVRTLTRLKRFSVSIFNCADLAPPRRKLLMNDASTFRCVADRASVMVRGALPKVDGAGRANAAGLTHVADG